MIISKTQVQNILKVYARDYKTMQANGPGSSQGVAKRDELTISDAGRLKQRAMQAVKETDDIRMDKVAALQQSISTGTYILADDEVAEKIIQRAIVDKLV